MSSASIHEQDCDHRSALWRQGLRFNVETLLIHFVSTPLSGGVGMSQHLVQQLLRHSCLNTQFDRLNTCFDGRNTYFGSYLVPGALSGLEKTPSTPPK